METGFNQIPSQVPGPETRTQIEITNLMQVERVKASGLNPLKWIIQYAEHFRILIENESKLLNDYKLKPEETLSIIAGRLQKKLH